MVIFRTSGETIDEVVRHAKHALNFRPNLTPGELILISQTKQSLPRHTEPIQYRMEFVECVDDSGHESEKIWGRYWPYLIIGKNCNSLRSPFDICKVIKNPTKDYGQGGPIVYVNNEDEHFLESNGYLD